MKTRPVHFSILIALLTSLFSSAVIVTPAHAVAFTPATAVDLINDINTANSNNADDTITLSSNIILTAIDNGQNGLPVILTDNGHSLVIEGGGFTLSRSGAAPDFRILQIGPGANVTINDLTITGGSNAAGAGIIMQTGSTVVLDNVEVSGNANPTGRGGGIYNYSGNLTIQNGSVIGKSGAPNIACAGGGVFTEGTPSATTTLDASTVSYNQSTNCPGGGFYMLNNAQLIIQNGSVVSNNLGGDPGDHPPFTSPAGGGGIFASLSPIITISDSTVSNNTANCVNNPNCGGGGLEGGTSVTVTNSSFSYNAVNCNASSPCGGGGILNFATLNIANSTFSGNTTGNDGGGIYNKNTLTITNSTISGNSAAYGGGINNQSSLIVTASTFSGNSATSDGGGIYNINTATATNSTLSSNTANTAGGGIFNSGTITLTNNTLSSNSAPAAGAGIYNASLATLNYTNTIIANSLSSGGDCISIGSIGTNANNLVEDGACSPALSLIDPNLGPLAYNGGSTQTHALLISPTISPAIDAGASCPSTDQRGVSRPQGAGCDIGAYELDDTYPTVVTTSLQPSYTNGPSSFTVNFSENVDDPAGNSGTEDVTNPANYLLIDKGANGTADTSSCAGGVQSDDSSITVTGVSYNSSLYRSSVTLASALPIGQYRLFVCATTSIIDPAQNPLNGGQPDYAFDFIVGAQSDEGNSGGNTQTAHLTLPRTGFAPNKVTSLPAQPASIAYSNLGDIWLEIPSLNVQTNIVGVPQSNSNAWDVKWLGNDAGWLNGTAFPTWVGNSVITGHVYNANGLPGPFVNLKNLKYGDHLIVHLYGGQYTFEIRKNVLVRPFDSSMAFQHLTGYAYLALITCEKYIEENDSYLYRRIVRAVLVDVK